MDHETRERFERMERNLEMHALEHDRRMRDSAAEHDRRMREIDERLKLFAENMVELEAADKNLAARIDKLVEAQKATDERLNILITTVEQLINRGQK